MLFHLSNGAVVKPKNLPFPVAPIVPTTIVLPTNFCHQKKGEKNVLGKCEARGG